MFNLKQAGQIAFTLGASSIAYFGIDKGFKIWNSRNEQADAQGNKKVVPLGKIQQIAKAAIALGIGTLAANYFELISLRDLASRFTSYFKAPVSTLTTSVASGTVVNTKPLINPKEFDDINNWKIWGYNEEE